MLLKFIFSNHRSFKEVTGLDMRASSISEYPSHLRSIGNDNVLPLAAIYGANASGKSNLHSAFDFMHRYVKFSSVADLMDKREKTGIFDSFLQLNSYKFTENVNTKCKYEVYFIIQEKTTTKYYNYGFVLDKNGVFEEWLKSNTKTGVFRGNDYVTIYRRKRNTSIELAPSYDNYRDNIELSLNNRVLILDQGAKLKIKECLVVFDWFNKNYTVDHNELYFERAVLNNMNKTLYHDNEQKKEIIEYLHSFDKSIVDIEVEETKDTENTDNVLYSAFSVHKKVDSDSLVRVSFSEESSGTKKMYALYSRVKSVLENGGVLFADELDTKLHPLLMRNLIITFTNPDKNPKNAQLIFTTHNTVYMEMGLFRRDEIWFVEKENQKSELFSLDDIVDSKGQKIRKDSDFEKNYLLGKYGAVPFIEEIFRGRKDG